MDETERQTHSVASFSIEKLQTKVFEIAYSVLKVVFISYSSYSRFSYIISIFQLPNTQSGRYFIQLSVLETPDRRSAATSQSQQRIPSWLPQLNYKPENTRQETEQMFKNSNIYVLEIKSLSSGPN